MCKSEQPTEKIYGFTEQQVKDIAHIFNTKLIAYKCFSTDEFNSFVKLVKQIQIFKLNEILEGDITPLTKELVELLLDKIQIQTQKFNAFRETYHDITFKMQYEKGYFNDMFPSEYLLKIYDEYLEEIKELEPLYDRGFLKITLEYVSKSDPDYYKKLAALRAIKFIIYKEISIKHMNDWYIT